MKNISGTSEKPSEVKSLSSATNGTRILFCGLIRHVNDITSNTTNDLRQQWRNASIGTSLAEPRNAPEALARMATFRYRGSLLPPIGINATRGEPHTKVEQAQWQVGSGIPRDPSLKTFIKPF